MGPGNQSRQRQNQLLFLILDHEDLHGPDVEEVKAEILDTQTIKQSGNYISKKRKKKTMYDKKDYVFLKTGNKLSGLTSAGVLGSTGPGTGQWLLPRNSAPSVSRLPGIPN